MFINSSMLLLLAGLSGGLFPAVPPSLNFTDYLDTFSKIVAVSLFVPNGRIACTVISHGCHVL